MSVAYAQETIDEIFQLYDRFGSADYIGEPVSQLEHMSQSAEFAMREGFDDEVVLAAFFHDIGHICTMHQAGNTMNGFGIISHEKIGANFLRAKGFPEKVARLVENHVQAKRYLTYKYADYYHSLSEASKRTLEFQGAKMTEAEATNFENDPLFEASIRMRKWDELAKETNNSIIDLSVLKSKAFSVLSAVQPAL